MDDYRKDEIIYDENWLSVSEPIVAQNVNYTNEDTDNNSNEEESINKQKQKLTFPALITIQLIVCLIIAFSVFILKAMNGDTYKAFCLWYSDLMQETILPSSAFDDIDLSQYFSTADEVSTDNEV